MEISKRNASRLYRSPWPGLAVLLLALAILGVACGSPSDPGSPANGTAIKLAPASDLPSDLRQLPLEYQEAYRFAMANSDVLEKIPCYCGCGSVGHMNNYMCYVQSETADGRVVLDYHAAG